MSTLVFGQTSETKLPKEKQTKLGLYVTAKEAFEKWEQDPMKVHILDVRTAEEYLFVGHFEMAWKAIRSRILKMFLKANV